jgi:hypothetical protein
MAERTATNAIVTAAVLFMKLLLVLNHISGKERGGARFVATCFPATEKFRPVSG